MRKITAIIPLVLFFFNAFLSSGLAQPSLPYCFSDHMVLQRGQAIPVWGWAPSGATVTVTLAGNNQNAQADKQGRWSTRLPAMEAGGPYELKVADEQFTVTFTDVLVGEVWVCSGQSNMEWPVQLANDAATEMGKADFPKIRLLTVPRNMANLPQKNTLSTAWEVCNPETVKDFSAVGYFFGRALWEQYEVPIGLIDDAWGGTVVETWMSPGAFAEDSLLVEVARSLPAINLQGMLDSAEIASRAWEASMDSLDIGLEEEWYKKDMDWSQWQTMALPQSWESAGLRGQDGVVWFKHTFQLTAEEAQKPVTVKLGPIDDSDYTFLNGLALGRTLNQYNVPRSYPVPLDYLQEGDNTITVRVKDTGGDGGIWGEPESMKVVTAEREIPLAGDWSYAVGTKNMPPQPSATMGPNSLPSLLYNGMIHPIVPYALRGAIWYQGESNADQAMLYRSRFRGLIRDWRAQWAQGDFPFLFVQLANFHAAPNQPGESSWAELREAQTMALAEPNTGMALAIDIGDANDIHPRNKQEVGRRLALAARAIAYGEELLYQGPVYESSKVEGNKITVRFSQVGQGLQNRTGRKSLPGFALAGADGKWHWANAQIVDKNTVQVSSDKLSAPKFLRYAWADNPGELGLYNSEGLPAGPFRTDGK
ncbi:MAG: beta galactosidase jelly roll domain-containing protein [Phaeodactylibacter sp.]|nr:beta galactosidase jelly roll domain-containing protein [Phaeodactylibacter sp.]MCB9273563.1 beta galactosidase jelly roll domain-containing protein [Lewinellaceae bacterium]